MELNGKIGVAACGPLSPDPSYRHSTLSFADRAPVIGVPKARYTVPPRGWLSGSGGGRPGTEATTRTPSAVQKRCKGARPHTHLLPLPCAQVVPGTHILRPSGPSHASALMQLLLNHA